ncbi:hypothetical protein CAC42_855 [Sphaceloma murrayae]|uniref:DUF7730 domain-containing protein n=1 Tax=Sphaceloma murrayae TaxID=2082308 RepID=A0A2K1QKA8_9PEZI|nr:hypothetical protein CAC42_855 [Sphaceloma murrayae]
MPDGAAGTNLLSLPPEIRLRIWNHVYEGTALVCSLDARTNVWSARKADPSMVSLGLDVENPTPSLYGPRTIDNTASIELLAVALVNRTFAREALPVLYSTTQLWISPLAAFAPFMERVPQSYIAWIRHVRVSNSMIPRNDDPRPLWNSLVRTLQLFKGLELLEVNLHVDFRDLALKVRRLRKIHEKSGGKVKIHLILPSHVCADGVYRDVSVKAYKKKYPMLDVKQAWFFKDG